MKKYLVILAATFLLAMTSCSSGGGGSDGGSSDDTPPPPASVNATGAWKGYYNSTVFREKFLTLIIQQSGNEITGTYSSSTGTTGSISGSVSGNNASFTITMTTPGCSGSFKGTGIINPEYDPVQMNFQYNGSGTCGGKESGTGILSNYFYQDPNLDQQQLISTGIYHSQTLPRDTVWQSFTAGVTGTLTEIDMGFYSPVSGHGQLQILDGEGISGTVLQTLTVTMFDYTDFEIAWLKWKNINVQVTAGHQYTFNLITTDAASLPTPNRVAINNGYDIMGYGIYSDPYPGGTSMQTGSDLLFRTCVRPES